MSNQAVLETSTPLSTAINPSCNLNGSCSTPIDAQLMSLSNSASSVAATGLKGDYFSGSDFNTLKLSRTDATVNFDWGAGAPDSAVGANDFSVRWTGLVQPKYSETYTFYTTSDDGVRLWVNGTMLVDNWTDHAATENKATIALVAGQKYDIKLEYYERGGDAVSKLLWSSPTQAKEVIPQSQLFTAIATTPNPAPAPLPTSELGPNLVLNGSFENTPSVPENGYAYFSSLPNWTRTGGSPNLEVLRNLEGGAADGANFLELESDRNYSIAQDISTEVGKRYQISFSYSPRKWAAGADSNTMNVLWNGQPLATVAEAGSGLSQNRWKTYTYEVTATSATTRLEFQGNGGTDGVGALLDKVQVREITGAKPSDPTLPTASTALASVITQGGTNYSFTVNYSDNTAINASSLDGNDIRITGANGFNQLATFVSATPASDGKSLTATYSFTAPGGSWNAGDNGTYTIALQANQVSDTSNNFAAAVNLGSFTVNIPTASNRATIGTNLGGIADFSTQWPFVDVFKTSREWVSQRPGASWGNGGPLKLTPEGWVASLEPGQMAEALMMIDTPHYPAGTYTLLYEGEGTITFNGGAKILNQSSGKMEVQVDPSQGGVFLQLRETNPNNPVRNIRFIMPGFESTYQTQPFHPLFLERLKQFESLRFMDWMATNNSEVVNWLDRATPNTARQSTGKGVALEYMIQLANTLKIDPWFTIPAKASNDYVQEFATMVRDRLDPSLKFYIEYSNEAWNGMFDQHRYVVQQGNARNLGGDDFQNGLFFYSERSVEIFNIFEQVFGTSTDQRVVNVLAGQAGNAWVAEQVLGWKDAYKKADVYAIAPYFDGADMDGNGASDLNDPSRVDLTALMTVDQIIDSFLADMPTEIKSMVDANYNVATKRFGVPLVAYEGGPHLTAYQFPESKVEQMTNLFAEANRNPRMRDVYREYLNQWQQSGGTLFNQFVDVARSSKWGFWGAMEHQNQDLNQAPKYQGLIDFINATSSQ